MPLPKKGEIPHAQYERNEQIIREHLSGVKDAELARKYGVSRQRIYSIVNNAGVIMRRDFLDAKMSEVLYLVQCGFTNSQIAEKIGHRRGYVASILHRHRVAANRHPIAMVMRAEEILGRVQKDKFLSVKSLTKGDRALRNLVYRLAKERGIVLNHWKSRERQRDKAIKGIMVS